MYVVRNHSSDFGDSLYGSVYRLADAGNKAYNFSYYIADRLNDFESKFGNLGSCSLDETPDLLSS